MPQGPARRPARQIGLGLSGSMLQLTFNPTSRQMIERNAQSAEPVPHKPRCALPIVILRPSSARLSTTTCRSVRPPDADRIDPSGRTGTFLILTGSRHLKFQSRDCPVLTFALASKCRQTRPIARGLGNPSLDGNSPMTRWLNWKSLIKPTTTAIILRFPHPHHSPSWPLSC